MPLSSTSFLRSLKKPKPFINLEQLAPSCDDPTILLEGDSSSFNDGALHVHGFRHSSPLYRTQCSNRSFNSTSVLSEKGAPICQGPKDMLSAVRALGTSHASESPCGSIGNTPLGSAVGTPTSRTSCRSSEPCKSPKSFWAFDIARTPTDFGTPTDNLIPGSRNKRPEGRLRRWLQYQTAVTPKASDADPVPAPSLTRPSAFRRSPTPYPTADTLPQPPKWDAPDHECVVVEGPRFCHRQVLPERVANSGRTY